MGRAHASSAGSVAAARPEHPRARDGSTPISALRNLLVVPVPLRNAKALLERNHYLHSLPGATNLAFGIFMGLRLMGALTFGSGPTNAYRLVDEATPGDCLALTRLWLSDELPGNSESRVIGIVLRSLARDTAVKFAVTYADPAAGHVGTIYQATNWVYTGLSDATPLYDVGDGVARHSRSLSNALGTHSVRHFLDSGVPIRQIPQAHKHRYVFFLDRSWRDRLRVPVLPYPKWENA